MVWTAASLIAFSAYACSRRRSSSVTTPSAGHTPKMFCSKKSPVAGSGGGDSSAHLPTSSVHSDGTCDSTPMRARTSSPRLVSCVDQRDHRVRPQPWRLSRRAGGTPRAHTEPCGLATHLVERLPAARRGRTGSPPWTWRSRRRTAAEAEQPLRHWRSAPERRWPAVRPIPASARRFRPAPSAAPRTADG